MEYETLLKHIGIRNGGSGGWDEDGDSCCLMEGEEERHPFDLEERTARFGEAIIRLLKKVSRNPINDRLVGQLAGCGTSIGANYCEANEPESKKDFRHNIARCIKEAKEAKYFLRMLATAEPALAEDARTLWREAKELHLILCSMRRP